MKCQFFLFAHNSILAKTTLTIVGVLAGALIPTFALTGCSTPSKAVVVPPKPLGLLGDVFKTKEVCILSRSPEDYAAFMKTVRCSDGDGLEEKVNADLDQFLTVGTMFLVIDDPMESSDLRLVRIVNNEFEKSTGYVNVKHANFVRNVERPDPENEVIRCSKMQDLSNQKKVLKNGKP